MSANHSLSGPSALKSRFTRSGAAHGRGAACLAPPFGRLAQPRVVPAQPLSRTPAFPSPWNTFGAP